jgi:hypothetical protein
MISARSILPVILVLVASFASATPLTAQKTDTVTLRNGNHITGEIKELSRGKLSYSTDDMGTLSIEWLQIQQIVSKHFFEIETGTGDRFFGLLEASSEPGFVVVSVADFSDTLRVRSIVRIVPIETTFWQRLDGRVDLGFNYQKANELVEYTLSGYVRHRVQEASTRFDYNFYFQTQETTDATTRNSVDGSYQRHITGKWSYIGQLGFEQNTQLNLDLRFSLLGAAGYFFAQTNKGLLQSVTGLAYTNEKFTGDSTRINNLEGAIGGEAAYFLFDSPKTDIDATLVFYPNITTPGRLRISFQAQLSYEVLSDFTIGFTVFDEFDSGAPSADNSNNDFGTTVSLGYKW